MSSVEEHARRALIRVALFRLVVEVVEFPFDVLRYFAGFLMNIASLGPSFSAPFQYMEQDAARRYRVITDVDLGVMIGVGGRYLGSRPGVYELFAERVDQHHLGGEED